MIAISLSIAAVCSFVFFREIILIWYERNHEHHQLQHGQRGGDTSAEQKEGAVTNQGQHHCSPQHNSDAHRRRRAQRTTRTELTATSSSFSLKVPMQTFAKPP
eukprot:371245-Rhodomonas_salina.2